MPCIAKCCPCYLNKQSTDIARFTIDIHLWFPWWFHSQTICVNTKCFPCNLNKQWSIRDSKILNSLIGYFVVCQYKFILGNKPWGCLGNLKKRSFHYVDVMTQISIFFHFVLKIKEQKCSPLQKGDMKMGAHLSDLEGGPFSRWWRLWTSWSLYILSHLTCELEKFMVGKIMYLLWKVMVIHVARKNKQVANIFKVLDSKSALVIKGWSLWAPTHTLSKKKK